MLATVEADAAKRAKAERQRAEARTQALERVDRGVPRARDLLRLLWLATAVVGALVLWPRDTVTRGLLSHGQQDGGSSYVGDTALMSAETPSTTPAGRAAVVEDLPKPLPEQLKPDTKGQCRQGLYAINGGCWMKVALEECRGDGFAYFIYKGTCYLPVLPRTRQPTSAPVKPPRRER